MLESHLKWLVEFANLNLNELKPGDKAKLLTESEEYLFREYKGLKHNLKSSSFRRPASEAHKAYIERFLDGIERWWVLGNVPQRDSLEYWSLLLHLQDVVKEELRQLTSPRNREFLQIEPVLVYFRRGPKTFGASEITPLASNLDDYVRFQLNLALTGKPRSVLQRCKEPNCGKYFVNLSFREKNFCSVRCMWRHNSAEQREKLKKDPKKYRAYLEKQKKYLRKRYEEAKEAQLGLNAMVGRKIRGRIA